VGSHRAIASATLPSGLQAKEKGRAARHEGQAISEPLRLASARRAAFPAAFTSGRSGRTSRLPDRCCQQCNGPFEFALDLLNNHSLRLGVEPVRCNQASSLLD
jgi:hypothetical protein